MAGSWKAVQWTSVKSPNLSHSIHSWESTWRPKSKIFWVWTLTGISSASPCGWEHKGCRVVKSTFCSCFSTRGANSVKAQKVPSEFRPANMRSAAGDRMLSPACLLSSLFGWCWPEKLTSSVTWATRVFIDQWSTQGRVFQIISSTSSTLLLLQLNSKLHLDFFKQYE